MVVPVGWHVPLATRLLRDPEAGATPEPSTHLIVRVLWQAFRQVAGALTSSDSGDHLGGWRCCLGRGICTGSRHHEVARRGAERVGGKSGSREWQGGEAASTCAGFAVEPLEGTVGVEVFHGAAEGFVYCGRMGEIGLTCRGQALLFVFAYSYDIISICTDFHRQHTDFPTHSHSHTNTLPWCCSLYLGFVGLGVSDTLGSVLRLEFSEADMTRRGWEGCGARGTSVTYVAGTYSGFVLLAAPILRTCQRLNISSNDFVMCLSCNHNSWVLKKATTQKSMVVSVYGFYHSFKTEESKDDICPLTCHQSAFVFFRRIKRSPSLMQTCRPSAAR